ncbi:unnamed protein product, partial [Ixodes hexagonus]
MQKDIPENVWKFTKRSRIQLKSLETFLELIRYLNSLEKRTLENYLGWQLICDFAQFSGGDLQKAFLDIFKREWHDDIAYRPRTELCLEFLAGEMGVMRAAVEHVYIRSYFNGSAKTEVMNMIKILHQTFNKTLHRFFWMDEDTNSAAITKLERLQYRVGFWNRTLNETYIEECYKDLPQFPHWATFIEMHEMAEQNLFFRDLRRFEEVKNEIPYIDPLETAMYYDNFHNAIVLPAASLRGMNYQFGLPAAANFGTLGMFIAKALARVVGHEGTRIVGNPTEDTSSTESQDQDAVDSSPSGQKPNTNHAFDQESKPRIESSYPYSGKHEPGSRMPKLTSIDSRSRSNMWSERTKQQFLNNSKCLQDPNRVPAWNYVQSNEPYNFMFEACSPFGFTDYIGLHVAYWGYRKWIRPSCDDTRLPSMQYLCMDKLLFASYAL